MVNLTFLVISNNPLSQPIGLQGRRIMEDPWTTSNYKHLQAVQARYRLRSQTHVSSQNLLLCLLALILEAFDDFQALEPFEARSLSYHESENSLFDSLAFLDTADW